MVQRMRLESVIYLYFQFQDESFGQLYADGRKGKYRAGIEWLFPQAQGAYAMDTNPLFCFIFTTVFEEYN